MKITKRQLRRIIKEGLNKILRLNEYGANHGKVSWYETDDGIRFDIEGEGDELTHDDVADILNSSSTDDELAKDIQAAFDDADEYSMGY